MAQPSETPPPADEARPESVPAADAPAATPATSRPKQQWGHTLAQQAATVSAKLSPVVRRAGDRVAAASPTTLLLALLSVLLASSIVAALTFKGSLGVASIVVFIPMLSAAIGATTMRFLADRRKSQAQRENAREETRALHQIEYTLDYVDAKLTTALTQFGTDRHNEAVIGMFQAKAATELYLGQAPRSERRSSPEAAPEHIDLVSQYGLDELLTPRGIGSQSAPAATSNRSCA
ncbi:MULTISPECIES: hypothetical protein [Mycobacterium ulcerans group]|uniref:Membrane protein n=1 Tax=Mycobacterium liflandii (strain 128FXT) TaxID=459424 RepID=L7VCI2_MYCL1|nr:MULTISPECIES: hypothetical protein [Mycobacterium ulcerans group]ULL12004.1 hypothetical protein CKW46_24820 [Mycobacterium liflandii]AGC64178.1 putative membrane protein [Mycobacterium liflandii 128FXT]MBC9864757.1 hypothetical protein [Mycobacterium pseudoshottsii]MDC8981565.1 hypothetical protein [Mycobacterium marinum]MDC8998586.1 hypothetical protein [Mycobacterium marinum]